MIHSKKTIIGSYLKHALMLGVLSTIFMVISLPTVADRRGYAPQFSERDTLDRSMPDYSMPDYSIIKNKQNRTEKLEHIIARQRELIDAYKFKINQLESELQQTRR